MIVPKGLDCLKVLFLWKFQNKPGEEGEEKGRKLRVLREPLVAIHMWKGDHCDYCYYTFLNPFTVTKNILVKKKIYHRDFFNPIHHSIFFLPLVTAGGGHHPPYDKKQWILVFLVFCKVHEKEIQNWSTL